MKLHIHTIYYEDFINIADFRAGVIAWNAIRDAQNLASTEMELGCGDIYENDVVVAYVSYNGKVWEASGKGRSNNNKEILV